MAKYGGINNTNGPGDVAHTGMPTSGGGKVAGATGTPSETSGTFPGKKA